MNILIAGAGKGIGLALAQQIADGNKLFTISRNSTNALAALNTNFTQADVAKDDLSALDHITEPLHGLVYCPGSINLKPFNRLTRQDFLNDFEQNLLGAVSLVQKFLPNLKQAGAASIVLFSTVAVKAGMPFHASIAASKAAVEGFAKSLAAELAAHSIRVNVIAPSLTQTALSEGLLSSPEKIEAAKKRHPLQAIGNANDVAALAAFLLSEQAKFITGQVIGADGGLGTLKV